VFLLLLVALELYVLCTAYILIITVICGRLFVARSRNVRQLCDVLQLFDSTVTNSHAFPCHPVCRERVGLYGENLGAGMGTDLFDRDETRDVNVRDQDETETLGTVSETRLRPRRYKLPRRCREVW